MDKIFFKEARQIRTDATIASTWQTCVLKGFMALLLSLLLVLTFSLPAAGAAVDGKNISSQGAYILDFETGLELYSHNGDKSLVPASITKLMSIYLIFEAIENGSISEDTVVPISSRVNNLSTNVRYWNTVPLYPSQTYTVSEIVELVLVNSPNAPVVALAELLDGSEEGFIQRMNAKAQEMGITATYYGCTGMEDNYITPKSVAILARNLLTDYPQVTEISQKTSVFFHGKTYDATNRLLSSRLYEGADGLKTGTTNSAGYCLVGTAERDGVRIIAVAMKSGSNTQRYTDMHILLDYGFSARGDVVRNATMRLDPYIDVYIDDYFAESLQEVVRLGLMSGTSDTTFSPEQALSYEQALVALYRMSGSPEVQPYALSGLAAGQWYTHAVIWAYENQLIQEERIPRLSDEIQRQEFVRMLYQYQGENDFPSEEIDAARLYRYSDAADIDAESRQGLIWALDTGIISGITETQLNPKGKLTRGQCTVILHRVLELGAAYPLAS